jgi:hypothetical protein
MRPGCLVFALTLSTALTCAGQPTPAQFDATQLQDATRFRLVTQSEMAKELDKELAKLGRGSKSASALPGDPWQPTDVLSAGANLPRTRLIWVAESNAVRVLHYEQGGFAHTYGVRVEEIDGTVVKSVWDATTGRYRDYLDFLTAFNAGAIKLQLVLRR